MAEPFAAGVLNSLLQPRVPLVRVTRSTTAHAALAANFFSPVPRHSKPKSRADAPAVGHILECQAWAYPPAKQALWGQDGSMRTTLMGELEPADARSRARTTPKSSRPQFSSMENSRGQRQYHVSHLNAAQPARDYSHSSFGNFEAEDEQPVASTSASNTASPVLLFQEALDKGMLFLEPEQLSVQFEALQSSGQFSELSTYDIIELAQMLAEQIDSLCMHVPDAQVVREWGQRLRSLVDLVDESASSSNFPLDGDLLKSLRSRSASFMGDFAEVPELAEHALQQKNPAHLRHAYISRILALTVHNDILAALNYLFIETPSQRKQLGVDALVKNKATLLLQLLTRDNMQSAIAATTQWDPAARNALFDFVLSALAGKKFYTKSLHIIREMRQRNAICPSNLLVETCKGLASENKMELADEVFDMIPRDDPSCAAVEQFINLKRIPPDKPVGEAPYPIFEKVRFEFMSRERFDQEFPKDRDGLRRPKPSVRNYCGALAYQLHVQYYRRGIGVAMDMKHNKILPNYAFANMVLQCYFNTNDTVGLTAYIEYLQKIGFEGDCAFYTLIIRYFSNHLDSRAAAAVYDAAVASGVVPDKYMIRRLLGAHFRSGAWKDAISLFMQLRDSHPEFMDVHTYNNVLQGCLFMGAPFRTVFKMFMIMEKQGLIPNKFSYAILTRGALDASQFQFVEDIHREIMAKDNWQELADVAFYTNVVTGYIRMAKRSAARRVLNTMRRQGFEPTAITHAAIARAYATSEEEGGLDMAEEYIQGVVENENDQSWRDVPYGMNRKDPLALMYGNLIDARCHLDEVDNAERLVGEFLNNGGEPTIGILKSLLSLYGRLDRLDDFRAVWQQILKIASASYEPRRYEGDNLYTKMQNITAPVNIYTETLSKACFHVEVARTWAELSAQEHPFDASNWHAFAQACLRAGQIDQTFSIMEHSLQPLFGNALRNHFRESPDVTATHDEKVAYYKDLYWVPPPKPLHEPASRVRAAKVNKAINRAKYLLTDEKAMEIDFAFPLTLLRRIGPNWHDWKPRMATLESMLMAMLYLEDGFPIRALSAGQLRPFEVLADTIENRGETEAMLKMLHENHPRSIHRLRRFRFQETFKLGKYGFHKKYILSRISSEI